MSQELVERIKIICQEQAKDRAKLRHGAAREGRLLKIDPAYFSMAELSRYCGLSARQLWSAAYRTRDPLPTIRVGRRVLVSRRAADEWLGQQH